MSFATAADLAALLGRAPFAPASVELAQAELCLALATAAVQTECGQTFAKVTGHVAKLDGTWKRDLELPERPVIAVTAVAVNGIALDSSSWTWNGRQTIRRGYPFIVGVDDWRDDSGYFAELLEGSIGPTPMHWGGPQSVITVTHDHGLDDAKLPPFLKLVTLSVARRVVTNPTGIELEALDTYQVRYGTTAQGFELTAGECRLLKRFSDRAHAS